MTAVALLAAPFAAGQLSGVAALTCADAALIITGLGDPRLTAQCEGTEAMVDEDALADIEAMTAAGEPAKYACHVPDSCASYTSDGNRICTASEDLLDGDTDSDGTNDCQDVDDDNDGGSDEAEDYVFAINAARTQRNQDGDSYIDPVEMLPQSANTQISLPVAISYYDRLNADCDAGTDWADPYLSSFVLKLLPGGDVAKPFPSGWSEGTQVNDRATGSVSDGTFTTELKSPRLSDWPVSFWEIPKIKVTAVLYDNDVFDYDDQMDLATTSGTSGGDVQHLLTIDVTEGLSMEGDASCRARLTINLSDNAPGNQVRLAVADLASSTPVTYAQVTSV